MKKAGALLGLLVIVVVGLQLAGVWQLLGNRSAGLASARAIQVQRELGAAFFRESRYQLANEVLSGVSGLAAATAQDLVNVACVELAAEKTDTARAAELLKKARALDPQEPAVDYCLGLLAMRALEFPAARDHFQRVLELAPEDIPARLHLAEMLAETGDGPGARREFQAILDRGLEFGGGFYRVAMYRLSSELMRSGNVAEQERARDLRLEVAQLEANGIAAPSQGDLDRGNLAVVRIARPEAKEAVALVVETDLAFEPLEQGVGASAGVVSAVLCVDANGDQRQDLLLAGTGGVVLLQAREGGGFDEVRVSDQAATRVLSADLHNQGRPSFLLWTADGVLLRSPSAAGGLVDAALPAAAALRDACFVDYDHEGDLDLFCLSADGALQLWRHDGALPVGEEKGDNATGPVQWTDVSAALAAAAGPFSWVAVEDVDLDQDIDLVAGGAGADTVVLSNERRGRFQALAATATGLPRDLARAPVLADVNHDGLVDLLDLCGAGAASVNEGEHRFAPARPLPLLPAALRGASAADLNLDGELDLLTLDGAGATAVRYGPLLPAPKGDPGRALPVRGLLPVAADLDQDGDLDLVGRGEAGVDLLRNGLTLPQGRLRLTLQGEKDNRDGKGALVELRFGHLYQRLLWPGGTQVLGLGTVSREAFEEVVPTGRRDDQDLAQDHGGPQVLKVTWPNGVVQSEVHLRAVQDMKLIQKEGLVGSCPFLYTWNGEEYEFISDVLGITPLGLPMVEGQYVPPDHDELVRIEGRQLEPRDGEYVMAVTEELREATYLDRAELWVVDHPDGVEIHPEERFTFPPFPPQKIHTVRDPLPMVSATGSDGQDWTEALRAVDGRHAAPFEPLPSQYLGLVTPHHLDLVLPEAVATAGKVRLLMTGWLLWTDASVNVAAGHHPVYEFVPPLLMVPGEDGEFVPTGPPVGFPAGKTKTMVLDITHLVNRADLRLRLASTIRLYWDSIQVAVDEDDAPYQVTRIEPSVADLSYRGFSRPIPTGDPEQPERFDFHALRPPPYDQHVGMLTAYGDVLPLLGAIDDCFVVFSAGDSLDLRFDATAVPPLAPGQARTFLLFLDGWAKDGDFNTVHGGRVEPLPFHGMSGYPYGADESYPTDQAHQDYLRRWNTRPGRRLVPDPLGMPRAAAAASSQATSDAVESGSPAGSTGGPYHPTDR